MPASLYCKHCMSFVPHTFVPVVPPDRRLRIKAVCTHCDRAGAQIGHNAATADATSPQLRSHLSTAPGVTATQESI
jgi:hypothetical protein